LAPNNAATRFFGLMFGAKVAETEDSA
jgi:hypothetical protein